MYELVNTHTHIHATHACTQGLKRTLVHAHATHTHKHHMYIHTFNTCYGCNMGICMSPQPRGKLICPSGRRPEGKCIYIR